MALSFTQLFSSLVGKKGGSVLGIDIGSSSIKIVQLRRSRGVAVLETYGELALGPYTGLEIGQATKLSTPKVAAAITDLMREANTTTQDSGMSIPFTASLVTLLQMPSMDQKQLSKMIPIEARKYIPVPVAEVTLDWFIVPRSSFEGDGEKREPGTAPAEPSMPRTDVLLVAIHNAALNGYRDIVKSANLSVSFFEIEIFSTIRSTMGQSMVPIALLDIGAGSSKLYIVEYGVVRASHLINHGSQEITLNMSKALGMSIRKAEELKREVGLLGGTDNVQATEIIQSSLTRIFGEANRAILNFERRYNKNVGQVVLTGGGSVLKGLLEQAETHLETEVVLGDPFGKTETPAFLSQVLKEVGPEFAVAVGLALRKLKEYE